MLNIITWSKLKSAGSQRRDASRVPSWRRQSPPKGGRAVSARSEEEGGVRGRERATRNQRGVEFKGYRGEKEENAGEKGRAWVRLIREEGREGIDERGTGGHRHIIFSETRPCEWTESQGRAHRGIPLSLSVPLPTRKITIWPDEIVVRSTNGYRECPRRSANSRAVNSPSFLDCIGRPSLAILLASISCEVTPDEFAKAIKKP